MSKRGEWRSDLSAWWKTALDKIRLGYEMQGRGVLDAGRSNQPIASSFSIHRRDKIIPTLLLRPELRSNGRLTSGSPAEDCIRADASRPYLVDLIL